MTKAVGSRIGIKRARTRGFCGPGRVLAQYDWGIRELHALCFAPDGMRCAAAGTYKMVVWDVDG
jgi:hypothetical protein